MAAWYETVDAVRARPGDSFWSIAERIAPWAKGTPQWGPWFQSVGNMNAWLGPFPGQSVLFDPALVPARPPSNTLDRYPDRLRARITAVLDADTSLTSAQRSVIDAQVAEHVGRVDALLATLAEWDVDPASIDLDLRHDDTVTYQDFDGPQNLDPGQVIVNARYNGVVQTRGDETSPPIILLNPRHIGPPDRGSCFKLYGDDCPVIIVNGLIDPATPTWEIDGVRGHHVTTINTDIRRVVDGYWPMDLRSGPRRADMLGIGGTVSKLSFFAPTPGRPEGTHVDDIQYAMSRGVTWFDMIFTGDKDPNVGQGGIVDPDQKWRASANACFQLGTHKSDDSPGDWLSAFCRWERGRLGWNLSANRPFEPPVTSIGDVWDGLAELGDVAIPSHLRDTVTLVGATRDDGLPLDIKYWN